MILWTSTFSLKIRVSHRMMDFVADPDAVFEQHGRAAEARRVLLEAMNATPPDATAILLSGGLDTAIIAQAPSRHRFSTAITVSCGQDANSPAHDLPYAKAIAMKESLEHHIVSIPDTLAAMDPGSQGALHLAIQTLQTFDPMELRGGVAVAMALLKAKALGMTAVVTGDGADEMFAGYSFLVDQPPEKLQAWRDRAAQHMKFCATTLGAALGISVYQPYIQPNVIAFALTCTKDDLVGSHDGIRHGKFVLRAAFPEAHSRWRAKIPLETGAGLTPVGTMFQERAQDFEQEKQRVFEEDAIVLRDAEHLHYYKVFRSLFASKGDDGILRWTCKAVRFGSDPCIQCGFQLERPDQLFCKTCGAWPARST
ncbi:unnamed protein product [Aphanomyces euteiches]